jgi:hypothetical protein
MPAIIPEAGARRGVGDVRFRRGRVSAGGHAAGSAGLAVCAACYGAGAGASAGVFSPWLLASAATPRDLAGRLGGGANPSEDEASPEALTQYGFNDAFKKPFDVALLAETVRTLADEKRDQ